MAGRIICVGNDALLLETRCWILERRFHVYTANGLGELAALLEANRCDLLVLCQTLSAQERQAATLLFRQNSQDAKVLTMLRPSQRPLLFPVENRFDPIDGPEALLERVGQLLRSSAPAQAGAV